MLGGFFNTGSGGMRIGGFQITQNNVAPVANATVLTLGGNKILVINNKAITIS